ncbi:unnamed protein product [Caretta caretta]
MLNLLLLLLISLDTAHVPLSSCQVLSLQTVQREGPYAREFALNKANSCWLRQYSVKIVLTECAGLKALETSLAAEQEQEGRKLCQGLQIVASQDWNLLGFLLSQTMGQGICARALEPGDALQRPLPSTPWELLHSLHRDNVPAIKQREGGG